MKRGLLVQHLQLADAGLYMCISHEQSYSQVLERYRLHIIPNHHVPPPYYHHHHHQDLLVLGKTSSAGGGAAHPGSLLLGQRNQWQPQSLPPKSYKDLQLVGGNGLSVDEYCEQLWYREKRRQQKMRTLKLKQESRRARVRRNNPPLSPI